jgi:flagellar motor switch/type III secretory pathway protein FliN
VTGRGQVSADANGDVEPWDPRTVLRTLDVREARLANGFLRCHPERWCPGFSERWTPLVSSLGCEVRVVEIKPSLALPDTSSLCFRAALDREPIVVAIDSQSAQKIAEEIVPRIGQGAHAQLILEYIAQRFVAVLGMCQIASESAGVKYEGRCDPRDVPIVASVKLTVSVHSTPCTIMVGLGQELVERMDKLWRRQVHSSSRNSTVEGQLRFELAQLGVPPQMLSEYLTKGTVIDLETRVSDAVTLRLGHKLFMAARMVEVGGKLACQTIQGVPANVTIPEGTSRLSIEIASLPVDAALVAELSQVGAVISSDAAVSDSVSLSINQERVAEARLCVYQGRYAVEVV